ncbi:hypothetical protein evm_013958 [Chilo suppressalis]|nr:hypothetical protein evm_013958 [Chilo suppressalis]
MQCEIGHLEEELQENLIDLRNDLILKRLFEEKELSEFWVCLNPRFPKLSSKAVESLLPFGSSYLCEKGFSTLTEMKSKKRERLQMIDEEMRVCREEKNLSSVCRESKKVARHWSKLKNHLRKCHPDRMEKDLKYFKLLRDELRRRHKLDNMFSSAPQRIDDGLKASYNISLLIAKSGNPHTVGKRLILPAIEEVLKTVLHKPASDVLKKFL